MTGSGEACWDRLRQTPAAVVVPVIYGPEFDGAGLDQSHQRPNAVIDSKLLGMASAEAGLDR